MTRSTSPIIYEFVREFAPGEEFTAYQLYQVTEVDGTTHATICGILHRLVKAGMLTIPPQNTRLQWPALLRLPGDRPLHRNHGSRNERLRQRSASSRHRAPPPVRRLGDDNPD